MMFTKLVNEELIKEYQVFDVRPRDAWTKGVIENSVLLDLDEPDFVQNFLKALDPAKKPAIICTAGVRSREACALIEAKSDIALLNLDGGINELVKRGYILKNS